MVSKRIMQLMSMGSKDWIDPLKPMKMNTKKSRIGNLCSYFDCYKKEYPEGFIVDKGFVYSFIGCEMISTYLRNIFKNYGYQLRVYTKKPFIHVSEWKPKHGKNSSGGTFPNSKHIIRDSE